MLPESRINIIQNWLSEYVSNMPNPATSLVVGVSGGIDSAVVSTICSIKVCLLYKSNAADE